MSILDDAEAKFIADAALIHQFAHGGDTEMVQTESGPRRTLAKLLKDNELVIEGKMNADGSNASGGLFNINISGRAETAGTVETITTSQVKYALGITTLSGENTGDQTKESLGLGSVENKSSATIRSELTALNVTSALAFTPINPASLGAANGVATLGGDGKLTAAQIPSSLVGALVYQGTWNASTNTPTLVSSVGTKGHYYKASSAGTTNINNNAQWNVGDHIIFDGTTWDRLEGDSTEVTSVAGRVGAVVLVKGDVGLANVDDTADVDKPVSTAQGADATTKANAAQAAAIAASAPVTHVGAGDTAHATATISSHGFMSAADKEKLDGIAAGAGAGTGTVTGVTATGPVVSSGGTAPVISMPAATNLVSGHLTAADWTAFNNKQAALGFTPVNASTLGAANGTATLGSDGKLTAAQIPSSLVGALVYQGTWNASTNTPTLVAGAGIKGHYYKVSVAGITSINGNAQWNIGDHIIFDGTTWDRLEGDSTEVTSVAGRVGAVVLAKADVGLSNVDNTSDMDKPISIAQAEANDISAATIYSATTMLINDGLAGKAPSTHVGSGGTEHAAATTTVAGFMSGADKLKLDGIASGATANLGTVTSVTATGPVVSSGGTAPVISMPMATNAISGYLSAADRTAFAAKQAALGFTPADSADLGVANGIATLGVDGKLTAAQIPSSLVGALVYQGTWNAVTNSPALVSSVGTKGHYYKVSFAGTTNINGNAQWQVGDHIIFNGTTWDRLEGDSTEVTSVSGRVGAVVLTKTDVGLANVDNTSDVNKPVSTAQAAANTAVQTAAATDATTKASAAQTAAIAACAPVAHVSAGGAAHANVVSGGAAGFMTGNDKNKLDSMTNGAAVSGVTATGPVVSSGGNAPVISMPAATNSVSGYLTAADHTAFNAKQAALGFTPVNAATLGAANGTATLGADGKLTAAQIPSSLVGALVYQGTWNASTNSPTLVSSTGTQGHYYKVSVVGTTNINGNAQWNIGDHIIFDGTTWDRLEGDSTEVTSVAGRVGAVVLTKTDVGLANVDNTSDANKPVSTAQATANTAVQTAAANDATTKANAAQAAAIAASAPVAHVGAGGTAHADVTTTTDGFMTAADKVKLNGIATGATANLGTITAVTATGPVVSSGGTTPVISMPAATNSVSGYLTAADRTAFNAKQAALGFTPADAADLGIANGIATLGADGKLTTAQIPASLVGALVYQGVWNASTNVPALANGTGTKGHYYKVSVGGLTSINGNASWNIGDHIIYNGTSWDRLEGDSTEVTSVAGRTGAVILTKTDVGLANVDNTSDLNKPVSTAQAAADTVAKNAAVALCAPVAHVGAGGTAHADVTTTTDGFMTAADKVKLNGIATGATANIGTVTASSVDTLTNKTITGLEFTKAAIAASAINLILGNFFTKTITAATTFTLSNIAPTGSVSEFVLELTNGGAFVVTWWANIKWPNGLAPILSTVGVDTIVFYTHDGGATWRGAVVGKDFK